jgi:hypothetical protein
VGISVSLANSLSFNDGVVFILLAATSAAIVWTMLPPISDSFWSKFREPRVYLGSWLRNDHKVMLTRQQRRAFARRTPPETTPDGVIKASTLWMLTQTCRLLKLSKYLLWPIKQLPLWANIIGAIAATAALYGLLDEAVPYIEPDEVTSTSWHDLLFKAKIDSRFFGASDVQVLCAANEIGWKGNGVSTAFRGKAFVDVDSIEKVIPPHGTISFACNMAENNAVTPPGDPVAPVSRIELHLLMRYRSFLRLWGDQSILVPWQREMTSQRFTWREVSPGNFQWLEGEPHVQ